ncbi:MiaB/RimO family radical SAM methylthiotransferase [Desulfovibrio cuneatus]|uniref:MiaB/RimO family radical SAM methylthiotransferase n=1 Tax=Desulfovibrio cuneatus TaxID=159728 RepID=UPI0004140196|nr:MiaB/RimO family radical SAM methylthiotransferase [Desulfovibrio cuneatus]
MQTLAPFRFFLATLGCKVNQYESHALREAWLAHGCTEVVQPEVADVVLVNSCAVTAGAVADVRSAVRRLHRLAPQARIVITGCAAEVLGPEMAALEGVTRVVPQHDKALLLQLPVLEVQADDLAVVPGEAAMGIAGQEPPAMHDIAAFPPFQVSGYDRSRAIVKVQDGCSHRCTYCIVPSTRGKARSRPVEDALAEIERLLVAGFREIGINGVNLRQFGRDLNPAVDFWDFMERVEERFAPVWAGRMRLRISSLEPGQLTDKALVCLQHSNIIAPQLHLSLQSGSPAVLRRMGRGHYDPNQAATFMQALAKVRPVWGLGADIIAGFPGETEKEFAETMALCQALPLSYAHVFAFSKRPGTPAATMQGQVAGDAKKARTAALRALVATKATAFVAAQCQLPVVYVVPEGHKQERGSVASEVQGVNEYYTECRFTGPVRLPHDGSFVAGRPVQAQGTTLLLEPVELCAE